MSLITQVEVTIKTTINGHIRCSYLIDSHFVLFLLCSYSVLSPLQFYCPTYDNSFVTVPVF
jgi:hypothetical protein